MREGKGGRERGKKNEDEGREGEGGREGEEGGGREGE